MMRVGAWPLRNLRTLLAADHAMLFAREPSGEIRLMLADPPQLPSQAFRLDDDELWPRHEALLIEDGDRLQQSPVGWVLAGVRGTALAASAPSHTSSATLGVFALWLAPQTPPPHVRRDPNAIGLALREQLDFVEAASDNRHARIRLDVLMASLPEGIVLTDEEHGTALVNRTAAELLDIREGLVDAMMIAEGMRNLHLRMSNVRDVEREARRLFTSGDATRVNWVWEVLTPERRTLLVNTAPVRSTRHRGRLWSFHDVTALRSAEAEQMRLVRQLERERMRLAELLASAPALVFMLRGPEHVIEFANEAAQRLNANTIQMGRRLFADQFPELDGTELHRHHQRVYETGEPWHGEALRLPARTAEGAAREVYVNVTVQPVRDQDGAITGLFTHGVDVTAQVVALEHLRQSQKMEAMGRLAGGVAHDFNNLLTVIGGNTELLLASLPPMTQAHADASEVREAATRAADLTRQLLHFSRRAVLQRHLVELDGVVRGVQQLLRRVIGEQVALEVQTGLGSNTVEVDPGQIEQVLVNLAVNARDAIHEAGRESGRILIRTDISADPPPAHIPPELRPRGAYARITVQDNGRGMDAETLAQACEPFFTTKPAGQGTGIGLATVSEIVRSSGGCLWMESSVPSGTTVSIALPLASSPAATPATEAPPMPELGAGTILLVEDEVGVRHIAQRILEDAGYRVLIAENGQDGLRAWRRAARDGVAVDLVITDVVMPDMGGRAMIAALRAERPTLPTLFMSGYVEGGLSDEELSGRTGFLGKPFTRADLLREVGALMAPSESAGA